MKSANSPKTDINSISSSFSHDVSTPLATAKMNADLLLEYIEEIGPQIQATDGIPHHIKIALINAPKLISQNVSEVQALLSRYKNFLNTLDKDAYLANETQAPDNSQPQETSGSHLQILLVDDEQIHHDIAESVLGQAHTIQHVFSGEAAIEVCQQQEFDVVLMDMQMPGLSGKETTEKLCELLTARTKIVGLTSMPVERQKSQLKKSGFYDFLDKPLKQGMLENLLTNGG